MSQSVTTTTISRPASVGVAYASQQQFNDFLNTVMYDDMQNVFFANSEFRESCLVYHSLLETWVTYNVMFDDPSTTIDFGSDADLSDLKPQVMISTFELSAKINKDDKVKIRGTQYIVEDVNNDGVGVTTVFLRRR